MRPRGVGSASRSGGLVGGIDLLRHEHHEGLGLALKLVRHAARDVSEVCHEGVVVIVNPVNGGRGQKVLKDVDAHHLFRIRSKLGALVAESVERCGLLGIIGAISEARFAGDDARAVFVMLELPLSQNLDDLGGALRCVLADALVGDSHHVLRSCGLPLS